MAVCKPWNLLLALFLISILSSPAAFAREPRRDPQSQRIRLKFIGDCMAIQTPTRFLEADPLISLKLVPSSIQELAVDLKGIRRYMRLYMPRTFDDLVGNTDVVMLSNSAADYFQPEWLRWVSSGTERDGLGLLMIGGLCSFGGFNGYIVYPDWGQNQIGEILPVDTITTKGDGHKDFAFKIHPVLEENPLVSFFDWEKGPTFFSLNTVSTKLGAKIIAVSDPQELPLLAYQDVGAGSSIAFTTTWGSPWGNEFVRWEFFPDFSADMVYYSAGIEIPDPVVVHQIRMVWEKYQLKQDIVRSVLEFVDRLGGRTVKVQRMLDDITIKRGETDELYINQEYEGCYERVLLLLTDLTFVTEAAMESKNAAFLWVYIIEWAGVTATLFLSGYFLYIVMIRRRLYKQVASTRSE